MTRWIGFMACLALVAGIVGTASDRAAEAERGPAVVDGVSLSARAAASTPSGITLGFEPPKLFAQSLPLQVYMSFYTKAYFVSGPRVSSGNGVVLDVSSFRVTGYSEPYAIAWNSIDAVNADGTIPSLPQLIWFLGRAKSVSMKVGSHTSQGEPVTLAAYTWYGQILDVDSVMATPEMQTLSVEVLTKRIQYVVLDGPAVLVADDITFQ